MTDLAGPSVSRDPAPSKTLLILASTYPRWSGDPEPGFVHELAKRLVDRFRVVVLCPHAKGAAHSELMDGVEVRRYRYAPSCWEALVNDGGIVSNLRNSLWKYALVPGFLLAQLWHAWRLHRTMSVDVVHAHWLIPQGVIAALLPVPFVVTSHGADLYALRGRTLDAVKRFVLNRARSVTVVSSAMLDRLATLGDFASRVSVLSMGVDVSGRFVVDGSVPRSKDEIIFVGRLVEKKGLRFLLQALPEIVRQRPSTFLTIAGFGPDESMLRGMADKLGIADSVRFIGALPQAALPAVYQRAALFVAPFIRADSGDQEGLPVALMEALACGCPVVAGDVAGLYDLLGNNARNTLCDPRDKAELVRRILTILEAPQKSREQAAIMSGSVKERFSWERISADYADLLESAAMRGVSAN